MSAASFTSTHAYHVREALVRILNCLDTHRSWIDPNNPFNRPREPRTSELDAGNNAAYLADYIVASGPLHCLDGWSYLGKAFLSATLGDLGIAIHLSYYAGLRATLALAAAQGYGIIGTSYWDLRENTPQRITQSTSTNVAAKRFLREHLVVADVIRRAVQPFGHRWDEWANSLQQKVWGDPLQAARLREILWGKLDKAHGVRGIASYRPDFGRIRVRMEVEEVAKTLLMVWRAFEPIGDGRFPFDDYFLLWIIKAIDKSHEIVTENDLIAWLSDQFPETRDSLNKLLSDPHPLVKWLEDDVEPSKIEFDRQFQAIVAWSALLLRLATGAWRDQLSWALSEIDMNDEALRPWMEELWDTEGFKGDLIESVSDLWGDIEAALEDLEGLAHSGDLRSLHHEGADPLIRCSKTWLIWLWGIIPS